jgi:glycosyltransferase involved in cell wall biosynthesis
MRVLWFSNTPAMGEDYLRENTINSGGWMKSLDKAVQNAVELHVAFYWPYKIEPYKYMNTYYHPIFRGNIVLENLKNKWLGSEKDTEDLGLFLSIIEEVKPDIIHIHGTENPFGCVIGKTNIPVTISIQGNLTVICHKYFSGFERKYLKLSSNKNRTIKGFLLRGRSWRYQYNHLRKKQKIESRNLSSCRYIIGRTDWDRRITRILAPKSLYFHVGEIMREIFFTKQWQPNKNKKFIVHTTNGNTFYKGFETLCYALTLLNDLNIDIEWRVAGIKSDSTIVKLVKRKLKSRYPTKGLALLGSLNEDKLCEKLLEADVYVMTSHIENSPNNLSEAMLLGIPCIATLAGGTGSILKDREEGIIIQDGDPWAMAGAVLELMNNPAQAKLYGYNARNTAVKRHNKYNVVSELLNAYKSIINKNDEDFNNSFPKPVL